jgi:hypothetical protein
LTLLKKFFILSYMNNASTAHATTDKAVNLKFNRRGYRRQSQPLRLRVFAAIERRENARADAKARGEFACWNCQTSLPLGTDTCSKCASWTADQTDNKVEAVRCESCGAIEGARHNRFCG